MDKTLLLIICDFLLLSLLSLVQIESPEQDPEAISVAPELTRVEAPSTETDDMEEALKAALEAEQLERERLNAVLEDAREEFAEKEQTLEAEKEEFQQAKEELERDLQASVQELEQARSQIVQIEDSLTSTQELVAEKEAAAAAIAEEKRRLEEERAQMLAARQELEREKSQLTQRVVEAQERITEAKAEVAQANLNQANLTQSASDAAAEAAAARERIRALQKDLQERERLLAEREQERALAEAQLASLDKEREELATNLQVVASQRETLEGQLNEARTEIAAVQQEKQALMEHAESLSRGVSDLAQSSTEIKERVEELKPVSSNEIYDRYLRNRVYVRFSAGANDYDVESVLVNDRGRVYAIAMTENTPFRLGSTFFGNPRSLPGSMSASVRLGNANLQATSVGFLASDPRIIVIPVSQSLAEQQGVEIFQLTEDPFAFPDAVLISHERDSYGETAFKIDPRSSRHLQMVRQPLSRALGKFVPRPSDIVFSQRGELIGLMVNRDYVVLSRDLSVGRQLPLGPRYNEAYAERVQSDLRDALERLPADFR